MIAIVYDTWTAQFFYFDNIELAESWVDQALDFAEKVEDNFDERFEVFEEELRETDEFNSEDL